MIRCALHKHYRGKRLLTIGSSGEAVYVEYNSERCMAFATHVARFPHLEPEFLCAVHAAAAERVGRRTGLDFVVRPLATGGDS